MLIGKIKKQKSTSLRNLDGFLDPYKNKKKKERQNKDGRATQ